MIGQFKFQKHKPYARLDTPSFKVDLPIFRANIQLRKYSYQQLVY